MYYPADALESMIVPSLFRLRWLEGQLPPWPAPPGTFSSEAVAEKDPPSLNLWPFTCFTVHIGYCWLARWMTILPQAAPNAPPTTLQTKINAFFLGDDAGAASDINFKVIHSLHRFDAQVRVRIASPRS
jgi:hypothetical protein